MNFGPLVIGVDYPTDLLPRNQCLVCFVIQKSDKKVVATAIVERESLWSWYSDKRSKFNPDTHEYILSTTSIVGIIVDMAEKPDEERRTLITPQTVN